ncbi:cytochrome c oxidase assembly protein CtaG/Cox11-domain-containing protein [Dipodascopsis tothii]|uniref:cytochrome c oxidase assembly protein CtaG/Cox11-domain-containing protein n=1 Tax=Dipodascopsis tothii TaxID=44089 RepID=UPI0034CDB33C
MKSLGLTEAEFEKLRAAKNKTRDQSVLLYTLSVIIATLALSYAAVPLYRVLCQRTGWGGTPITDSSRFTPDKLVPVKTDRRIRIKFSGDVSSTLPWTFTPQQREVYVVPGETALAFFKAKNYSDRDVIGVATYNVTPAQVAPYFSKIQCFCFEQQQLRAREEVDMPIFFFIDPDFDDDPLMRNVNEVVLNYTFFKARYNEHGILQPVQAKDEFVMADSSFPSK